MNKINPAMEDDINALSIEIGVPSTNSQVLEKQQEQSSEETLQSKSLKDKLAYFSGKARDSHGIKINMTGKHGAKSVWLNPFNLLGEDDPMETEEMSRAMQSLGVSDVGKMKIKAVECKALGFEQSFKPAKKLDAQMLEDISLLSGVVVELEENGHTKLFKELLAEENSKNISDILALYETFEQYQIYDLSNKNSVEQLGIKAFEEKYPASQYTAEELDFLESTYDFYGAGKERLLQNGYKEVAGYLVGCPQQESEQTQEQEFEFEFVEEPTESQGIEMTMTMG